MRISHGTRVKDINDTNGYGYATTKMAESLERLGHEFVQNDPDAPVQIWFDQPHHWVWNDSSQYRVGYHPWESTALPPRWAGYMNEADEIWTPSDLIADWYKKAGITKPIYVYEHGVDDEWTPRYRKVDGVFKFLHLGTEAARKNGQEAWRSFRKVFGDREDVAITMKMIQPGFNIPKLYNNVYFNNKKLDLSELVDLFHSHHAYVYPSMGEGFGLTPLQAMTTGMPTITLPAWAPYREFLDPKLSISSRLVQSPDFRDAKGELFHPGKMFQPHNKDMQDAMRYVVENYDEAQNFAHAQVAPIKSRYDWDTLTKQVFDGLETRIKNR